MAGRSMQVAVANVEDCFPLGVALGAAFPILMQPRGEVCNRVTATGREHASARPIFDLESETNGVGALGNVFGPGHYVARSDFQMLSANKTTPAIMNGILIKAPGAVPAVSISLLAPTHRRMAYSSAKSR